MSSPNPTIFDPRHRSAKPTTAQTLWVPAINNHSEFGRWAFVEIVDPWDAKNVIQSFLEARNG